MKSYKSIILPAILLIVVSALYRIIPGRPFGFAPQYAMAIFGGALFREKKEWAFILPVASLLISDAIFEMLYRVGLYSMPGFYAGQFVNYILIAALAVFGFMIQKINMQNMTRIVVASVLAPTAYFILSNFSVWAMTDMYPKTLMGLKSCYLMGLPFYPNSVWSTMLFAAVLFGAYGLFMAPKLEKPVAA